MRKFTPYSVSRGIVATVAFAAAVVVLSPFLAFAACLALFLAFVTQKSLREFKEAIGELFGDVYRGVMDFVTEQVWVFSEED